MEFAIENGPSNAVVTATLDADESVVADPGAMITRSESVDSDTRGTAEGATGMIKSALSDELDVTETVFTATEAGGTVTLGPDLPGDIGRIDLAETGRVKVQSGGVVAWTPDVEKSSVANEAGNFFSSGELTVLSLDGSGTAFLSAFGALRSREVSSDDPVVVDEDHLLAWTDGLDVSRTKDSSVKSTLLGGEGFVTRFAGDGRVWIQTRDPLVIRGTGSQ
ncbi:TIGR00266 family protein [Candidatus Halobonum tyrrellensis]|uniref:TIGR00266 family protein n=1 Tax=Candidatus Halobonum tyrrellensis G22 TaxID=1324957 RepID=V4HFG4_9EURY|nr:TIGR00266 family protein [Candidatus Halobonum tyrrellensis]ESP88808.1 hypothetical protein K933_06922 [Candidatus Halobonum tyrrellensis G22]